MSRIVVGRSDGPTIPYEIREEVELFARKSGRHGSLHHAPGIGWFAKFSLRSHDKVLGMFQGQQVEEAPAELVHFHVRNPQEGKIINGQRQGPYLALDIYQMGASGVREFLEKGDTWSGRGEFGSIMDAVQHARDLGEKRRSAVKEEARQGARDITRDQRRQRLKIPFHRVGIDLGGDAKGTEQEQ